MNSTYPCPRCGAPLPTDAPEKLCPACLMSGGLPTGAGAATVPMGDSPRVASQPMAPRAPADLAPLFPQLEILELLGRGGMGAVYKARQKNLNRLVALKILTIDPAAEGGFGERFEREAHTLARLNHPNIVGIHDFGVADGLYFFVMEYVDGANLRSIIRAGHLQPEVALNLVPSLCEALQYAHDEGVVHRDIKPENVLVDKKGRVKIADFGLAKLLGQENADHGLTLTGMALGTPRYMAPEQLDRPESVDHRADIYSLGVVIYEMLTGEIPMGRFALPSEKVRVDVRIDEVVLRSLEREPERRYQRASEVGSDVEHITKTTVLPAAGGAGKATAATTATAATEAPDPLREIVLRHWPNKIAAIKAYREATGADLALAKARVEAIGAEAGSGGAPPSTAASGELSPTAFIVLLVMGLVIGIPFLDGSSLIGQRQAVWWTVLGIAAISLGPALVLSILKWRGRHDDPAHQSRWQRVNIRRIALLLALVAGAICYFGPWNRVYIDTIGVAFAPKSGAFEKLILRAENVTLTKDGKTLTYFIASRPAVLQLEILHRGGVSDQMRIDLPGLRATWKPRAGQDFGKRPSQISRQETKILSREALFHWLSNEAGLVLDDPAIQLEAADLDTFLLQWQTARPVNFQELFQNAQARMSHFSFAQPVPTVRRHAGLLPGPVFANLCVLSLVLAWLSWVGSQSKRNAGDSGESGGGRKHWIRFPFAILLFAAIWLALAKLLGGLWFLLLPGSMTYLETASLASPLAAFVCLLIALYGWPSVLRSALWERAGPPLSTGLIRWAIVALWAGAAVMGASGVMEDLRYRGAPLSSTAEVTEDRPGSRVLRFESDDGRTIDRDVVLNLGNGITTLGQTVPLYHAAGEPERARSAKAWKTWRILSWMGLLIGVPGALIWCHAGRPIEGVAGDQRVMRARQSRRRKIIIFLAIQALLMALFAFKTWQTRVMVVEAPAGQASTAGAIHSKVNLLSWIGSHAEMRSHGVAGSDERERIGAPRPICARYSPVRSLTLAATPLLHPVRSLTLTLTATSATAQGRIGFHP